MSAVEYRNLYDRLPSRSPQRSTGKFRDVSTHSLPHIAPWPRLRKNRKSVKTRKNYAEKTKPTEHLGRPLSSPGKLKPRTEILVLTRHDTRRRMTPSNELPPHTERKRKDSHGKAPRD